MPDFPQPPGGGATAAQVWAYGTKELTGDAANVIRDAILSDATKIPGADIPTIKGKTDALPTDPADQSIIIAATDAIVTSVQTRAPAGEYDGQLDAAISSRSPASEYDTEMAKTAAIQNFTEDSLGTLTATGSEDEVRESLVEGKLHAFIDLTAMLASDSITVRQYMKIKPAGSYVKYAEEVFADVQSLPMLYIVTKPSKNGIRITLEQTAGTNRDYDWETFIEKAA